jgi:hypothetical protein
MASMQSFNDVLSSTNICLVLTYKYDVGNCLFDFISSLLKCSLTSLQIKQNSMQYLKQCLTSNTQKHKNVVFGNWTQVLYMIYIMVKFQWISRHWKNCPKVLQLVAYEGILQQFFG